jgi:pimeloyl-ACP methyl ester carboxylesterase
VTSVFLIGGFNIHYTIAQSEKIELLKSGLEAKGYRVVLVDITWRRKTPSQFSKEFEKFYRIHRTEHNVVIGNSFGAIVALLTAPNLLPDELYLCSLSAFFSEDRGEHSDIDSIKYFGKRRMHDLWSLSFNEIAGKYNNLGIAVAITYGEKEKEMYPSLVRRCRQAATTMPNARLIELPGAPHSMNDPTYSRELLKYMPSVTRLHG